MQGWRKRQEDAHIADISQGEKKNIDVFGVFDGHGGKEISTFVSHHFTKELINNKNNIVLQYNGVVFISFSINSLIKDLFLFFFSIKTLHDNKFISYDFISFE